MQFILMPKLHSKSTGADKALALNEKRGRKSKSSNKYSHLERFSVKHYNFYSDALII